MSHPDENQASMKSRMSTLEARIVQSCLKAGRQRRDVELIAVSKLHSDVAIREAWMLGQVSFGENYVQEATEKKRALSDLPVEWHFIGHLQKNKAKLVVGEFAMIHSVDSEKLVQTLDRIAKEQGRTQKILLEVNLGLEESKTGISKSECLELINKAIEYPNLQFSGLMSLPPLGPSAESARPFFRELKQLHDECKALLPAFLQASFVHLSMGTTGDFEVAIEEGATLIRVGTAFFGERQKTL